MASQRIDYTEIIPRHASKPESPYNADNSACLLQEDTWQEDTWQEDTWQEDTWQEICIITG